MTNEKKELIKLCCSNHYFELESNKLGDICEGAIVDVEGNIELVIYRDFTNHIFHTLRRRNERQIFKTSYVFSDRFHPAFCEITPETYTLGINLEYSEFDKQLEEVGL